MMNRIVIHYFDGKIHKGMTDNFFPNKDKFILREKDSGTSLEVHIRDLKAVFFVKSYEGNPQYRESKQSERIGFGKKIQIIFKDGENLIGYTQGFTPDRLGFFFFPADPDSNNERVFVVTRATREVKFL